MLFFLDTEFVEAGREHPLQLISIGLVSETGEEFYAVSTEFDLSVTKDNWLQENVIPNLGDGVRLPVEQIAKLVKTFIKDVGEFETPNFVSYYPDYDWVVFTQLLGGRFNLPLGWPVYCNGIIEHAVSCSVLLPRHTQRHNALEDARWNRDAYKHLQLMGCI